MDLSEQELITEFVVESREGLSAVETQMLAIEACGTDVNADMVNAVFRTMHSIKGSAGFLGLDRIGELAHSLEEVLNRLRNHEIVPTSELISAVLSASDTMTAMIESIESSNDFDVTDHVHRLQNLRGDQPSSPATAAASSSPTTTSTPTNSSPAVKTLEAPKPEIKRNEEVPPSSIVDVETQGAFHEFLTECHENLDQMDRELLALEEDPTRKTLLRSIFRTIHTIKGGAGFLGLGRLERLAHVAEDVISDLRDNVRDLEKRHLNALLQSVEKFREGLQLVAQTGSDERLDAEQLIEQLWQLDDRDGQRLESPVSDSSSKPSVSPVKASPAQPVAAAPDKSTPAPQAPLAEAPARAKVSNPTSDAKPASRETAASPEGDRQAAAAVDTTIRVDVALLDKLMTRVGELVLARNQILQHSGAIQDANFISTAQRLDLITTELQEGVMKTRMQPIGNVWAKFPRVVRDLASLMGKRVRIEMEGKETELDKTIVEAIKDPLTHLIRNSVDHGIESPERRLEAGKPAEGVLRLRAFHEGGQVNIEISDDGAGLNIDRIRAKAVERGLMSPDQVAKLSDREATQLIMLPGFSTAQQVTSVSGRGVGMDVVKTNIERIGGMIDLHSRPGKGTTVKIKIPLTLAIIPALIITNRGDRYAIPQVSLLELVRLEGEQIDREIEFVHGAPVYRLRGKLLPLLYLSEQLDGIVPEYNATRDPEGNDRDRVLNIVVLRAQNQQFGLVVDRVNDTEEIVVKPLSRQLNSLGEYAGATIMGDGTVALILDVMGLAVSSGLAEELREQALSSSTSVEATAARETTSVLIVDLGDSRRFALPTSVVSRLEKAQAADIEYTDGTEVLQYRGNILPLIRLANVFGSKAKEPEAEEELQIVVYSDEERSCGLVVNRIADVVDVDLQFRSFADPNSNLIGTAIIQDRVTDVLNLNNLASRVNRVRFAVAR